MNEHAIDVAIVLATRYEGFSPEPYLCPAHYWTRGIGERCSQFSEPVTLEQAQANLRKSMERRAVQLCQASPTLFESTDARCGALLDFIYNLGIGNYVASTLRRRVNQDDWHEAARELRRWVYGGGRKLKGLVLRREEEALLLVR